MAKFYITLLHFFIMKFFKKLQKIKFFVVQF